MTNTNYSDDFRYRLLFENMLDGFAYCEMIFIEGEPSDFIFRDVNKAFYALTGLENVIGKPVSDVIPGLKKDNPELFTIYGRVATTTQAEQFETYLTALQQWLSVSVYSPEKGFFVIVFDNITKRKQAEESLRHKTALLEAQLNSTIDGIIIVDSEGKKIIQNKRTIDLWKIPQHIADNPDDSAQVAHVMKSTRNPNQFVEKITYLYAHPNEATQDIVELTDGTVLERYSAPVLSQNGHNYGRIWIFHDITERVNTIEELRRNEEKYKSLFNSMNEGFCLHQIVTDQNGTPCDYIILEANPAFEKIVGVKKDDAIGRKATAVYGVTTPPYLDIYTKVADSGQPTVFETDFKPMNKVFRIVVFSPARGMFATIFEDITRRKQIEHDYQLFRDRLNFAIEAAHMGAWELDLVDHTAWRSFRHDEIFGYKSLLPNWTFEMFIDHVFSEDRDFVKEKFQTALTAKTDWDFECRITKVDGTMAWIWAKGSPKYDVNNNPLKMFGIIQDITARKNAEQLLQNSQKLESIGVLAGGIAHDFNNLLGGIYGYIEMAAERSKDEKLSLYHSKAINTIERARALTQQLLTFAEGGAPIQKIDYLFPFVQETVQFVLSGAKVSCHYDVSKDLWACNFDKNQIGQVIDNIIINAQQAMPLGGIIEMTARNSILSEKEHPLLAKGNYVKISIMDTGIGIPKELLGRIFDPFFTTKPQGHGLGLATCYSIIYRHGGIIDVESEPGKGSTFHIYLPASMEDVSEDVNRSIKEFKGTGTFLVMDDEEVMRDTIGDMLSSLGYTVVCKENGIEALDFIRKQLGENLTFAGMIFDLTVPGSVGGHAAFEAFRKIEVCAEIPVFVASGYAEDPIMKNPSEYGFAGSICKPFRKAELSEMLQKYLNPTNGE